MSSHHAWLRFVADGEPLGHHLDIAQVTPWQDALSTLHARWYDGAAPPAVAAVFVLQWLLQVPAHTAAHGAASGPWRVQGLGDLTFSTGPSLVPDRVRIGRLTADERPLAIRLDVAEREFREAADPLAAAYPSRVRLGHQARTALVDDMWRAARREAEGATGKITTDVLSRASCCLIYALPGCSECAGCPRLRSAPPHSRRR